MNERERFRVIAEGDDQVACGLPIVEALAVADYARGLGKRHVAIVDENSGFLVDERAARRRFLDES